jgi:hypothetical protein
MLLSTTVLLRVDREGEGGRGREITRQKAARVPNSRTGGQTNTARQDCGLSLSRYLLQGHMQDVDCRYDDKQM